MHCVITGAADGIGRSVALAFGRRGFSITGIDVDAKRGRSTEEALRDEGISARFLIRDLADSVEIRSCADDLGEGEDFDILIHNAGINAVGRLHSLQLEDQLRVIDLNLTAPMTLTARMLESNKVRPGGALVFVSSLSHFVGYPGASAYAASKDGIASFARSLRVELRSQGVHVMTVFPGPTRTAHARRYSPDNSRESARMDPADLAERIYRGVRRKQRHLIPGFRNKLAAAAGFCFPAITERAMARAMLGD